MDLLMGTITFIDIIELYQKIIASVFLPSLQLGSMKQLNFGHEEPPLPARRATSANSESPRSRSNRSLQWIATCGIDMASMACFLCG